MVTISEPFAKVKLVNLLLFDWKRVLSVGQRVSPVADYKFIVSECED